MLNYSVSFTACVSPSKRHLDTRKFSTYRGGVECVALKRPLETEGIPPLIESPQAALEIFEEILKRGASFYPQADEASPRRSRIYRIVPLAES